ncbi:serine hydrolase [Flavobacterium sp. CYK-55]|uniref:serine hydrolase n=1 Tax=Flavobacterium sp. CYK-55 TaxID=2835529 RepID=UPI001BD070D8|nr:serine hydrolase [Flavobacterium sp. CYK-55]MBS7787038.1 serine hydrolase [Flavobacterium sp. CYK-55]
MKKIISQRVSLLVVIAVLLVSNLITFTIISRKYANTETTEISEAGIGQSCGYNVKRLDGYKYVKPLLFVDNQYESDELAQLKSTLTSMVDNFKNSGNLNSASIYIKEYNSNGWMGINPDEKYMPGSLMKVPELIAYLKMEELHPGTLDKVLTLKGRYIADKHPQYLSKSIQVGQNYSVRELLRYMIEYSDNDATSLLFDHMDKTIFKKVFTDFGMKCPDLSAQNYPITSREYTYFMRALYNASYLNTKNSEFATELLAKCNFKKGMVAGLPSDIKIAHKFGESGDPMEKHLSESAVIYLNNSPYTITIMTKGKDMNKLPEVIKQLSTTVYQFMRNRDNTSLAAS